MTFSPDTTPHSRPFYKPTSEFRYPGEYIYNPDEATYTEHDRDLDPALADITPGQALNLWQFSLPGRWQAGQQARYPTLHIDLPARFLPDDAAADSKTLQQYRHQALEHLVATERDMPEPANVVDFHPIGHMALVLCKLDNLLENTFDDWDGDALHSTALRHAAGLHDIGETEFPGAKLLHGSVIGDISAAVGKTPADRVLERQILTSALTGVLGEHYSDEVVDTMIKLISHDVQGGDKQLKQGHAILQFDHALNSVHTGLNMGYTASDKPFWMANHMSVLAQQTGIFVQREFDEILDDVPHPDRVRVIGAAALRRLDAVVHCRDENEEWATWRLSDEAIAAFGPYTLVV